MNQFLSFIQASASQRIWFQLLLCLGAVGYYPPAIAQIVPDASLGAERSQVNSNVSVPGGLGDRVEGGALRGVNLFHSFQEFNVNAGQRVYFANPANVQNIFSRVTGSNLSNINGTLGVDGVANLFLLNPNGILFGPNARLDVRGSFLATTANSFQFPSGITFGAPNPQAAPLLTVNVPVGLQYGATGVGTIQNRGNLMAGQDLTLAATNLDLQGQLQAGRDLTLQAQNTVKIRDTTTEPFLSQSGRDLTVQGNQQIDILALNHPQAALQSGGNLSLISDGVISGDAHFTSGGAFSILNLANQPGTFVSFYDPIIYANGNVTFGDYTGVALKIEATGSITGGNIRITGPDAAVPIADPDYAVLSTERALILRSGVAAVPAPNLPNTTGGTIFNPTTGLSPGIAIGDVVTADETGGNGGSITLLAAQGSIFTGAMDSSSVSSSGNSSNGGAITLIAPNGSISVNGALFSSSSAEAGTSRDGGAITLIAPTSSISINGVLVSVSEAEDNTGNGGAVTIWANNLAIAAEGGINSLSQSTDRSSGNGGAITLIATNGSITNAGNLDTYSDGDINSGNGGVITLIAPNGSISNSGSVTSYANAGTGTSGNGGAIAFTAQNISLSITSLLDSSATAGDGAQTGDGGAISLTATSGSIRNDGFLNSLTFLFDATTGATGNGGEIALDARNGDISGSGSLNSFSVAGGGTSGNGGAVNLVAKTAIVGLEVFTLSSSGTGGTVQITGTSDLSVSGVKISTSDQAKVVNPDFNPRQPISADNPRTVEKSLGGRGSSGNILVTGAGNITFNASSIQSDTKGSGAAGNVAVNSPGVVTFNRSEIVSNTSGSGEAGSITVKAGQEIALNAGSQLLAQTQATGQAGSITLKTNQLTVRDGAQVNTSSQAGAGAAGSLDITANRILLDNGGQLRAEATSGAGGDITINVRDFLVMRRNSVISATAGTPESGGSGGNININAPKGFVIAVPSENSDIIANAFGGRGGTIKIAATQIFGFKKLNRLSPAQLRTVRSNGTSDISASSDVGADGEINLSTLQVDPSQGLSELPVQVVDTDGIAQGCQTGGDVGAKPRSEFVITGRGGLAPGVDDPKTGDGIAIPWVRQPDDNRSDDNRSTVTTQTITTLAKPPAEETLVEAQGIAIAPDGTAQLTAQMSASTLPHQPGLRTIYCGDRTDSTLQK